MALTLDDIARLLAGRGQQQYGREAVSQLDHALQCAALAEDAGESTETVVAALLHDLGHLLAPTNAQEEATEAPRARDDLHQYIALPFLHGVFPPGVLAPIRLHVDAKRCLCTLDAGYWDTLSPASKHSLELQGGRHTQEEAEAFMRAPFAEESLRVRRYDDLAKVTGKVTPPLAHYLQKMAQVAL
ncbi:phosphonate degradation HD-domain oxygenase [Variovorax sp. PAMC26660]|uniref:phosphonate degradation HD-domain oxygenase n=1 Tax=Variovorax sp. PAMC26660 TaxID=2762322 RepID=UPI00164E7BD3|nr:phosphonate degradation HD-domain oxygenase [Variovorax sp. PAMC26660]QNK68348.1 HD domain-containing protein [Variovorax sp. PAMC26660]